MYLLEYLESRTDTYPALFVSLRSPHERLTDKGVEDIVRRTGRRVGVKAYPHKFRGTSITNAPFADQNVLVGIMIDLAI